jgi:cytidylate kinase
MGKLLLRPERSHFVTSSAHWRQTPEGGLPMVVVAGRSNVGKSSFINLLLRRRGLARTSSLPGRTRLINFFEVDGQFLLVDVPGYGFAEAPREEVEKWVDNLVQFVTRTGAIAAVVQLFDIRRTPSAEDRWFADLVRSAGRPHLAVITKTDKVGRGQRAARLRDIAQAVGAPTETLLLTSAKNGEGRDEVWRRIIGIVFPDRSMTKAGPAEEDHGSGRIDVVAIDGPSGAGKSTVARRLAERLGWRFLDTGAMYRAVGLKADREGVALDDDEGLRELCARTTIEFAGEQGRPVHILLDGEDVSDTIREHRVSELASRVSARKPVRDAMSAFQRAIGLAHPTVAEGRDMGTVVFPDARLKVYLTASAERRALRRTEELRARGQSADIEAILADIRGRDFNDSTREHAPLAAAPDAVSLDTSDLGIDEVVEAIAEMAAAGSDRRGQ